MKIKMYNIISVCILYLGIEAIFPVINGYLGKIDTIICMVLNIILFMYCFKYKNCFFSKFHMVAMIFFCGYSFLVPVLTGNIVWFNRYMSLMLLITLPIIFKIAVFLEKKESILKIKNVVLFFASITFFKTLMGLLENPYLSRSIKSEGLYSENLYRAGIGGYSFIYFFTILGVLSWYVFCKTKKVKFLIPFFCSILLSIKSNYTTSVIIIFLCMGITLIERSNSKNKLITVIIFILMVVLFPIISKYTVNFIRNISPDGRIIRIFENSDVSPLKAVFLELEGDRFPTIMSSIEWIKQTWGLGAVYFPSAHVLESLGQHSHIFDSLAIWGVSVGIIYCYLLFIPIKLLNIPFSIAFAYMILLFFNNVTSSIAIIMFWITPTFINIRKKNKN